MVLGKVVELEEVVVLGKGSGVGGSGGVEEGNGVFGILLPRA